LFECSPPVFKLIGGFVITASARSKAAPQFNLINYKEAMEKDPLFSQIYTINPSTNCYLIEIGLDQYTDIFDEWDPAPFKHRSIDPDLELYLEGSSEEIPLRYPVELHFKVQAGSRDKKMEEESQNGLKTSFAFKMYLLRKELKKTNTQILRCIALGLIFLWMGMFFSEQFAGRALAYLLAEAIIIGGWVFLWEAVSLFFFTNREIDHKYRIYRRLSDSPVTFQAANKADRGI
jgi:hypothetical protein